MPILHFFSSPFSEALGWSLLHSCWQAAAVFIYLKLILSLLPQATAKLKYLFAYSALVFVSLLFCLTFYHQFSLAIEHKEQLNQVLHAHLTPFSSYAAAKSFSKATLMAKTIPMLVSLYIIGLVLLTIRLLIAYITTRHLKKQNLLPVDPKWIDSLKQLKARLHINKPIQICISSKVDVPMMMGCIKPVILLPISIISNLSIYQIEAILIHELAHVRRQDYLFNLFQSAIETILFFNPFVWWISKKIREERENCCDQIVLQQTDNPHNYATALMLLESSRIQSQQLAMAAVNKKPLLFNRIKNIMEMKAKPINLKQKLAAVLIAFTAVCSIAWLSPKQEKTNGKNMPPSFEKPGIHQSSFVSDSLLLPAPKALPANVPLPPAPPTPPGNLPMEDSIPLPPINNNVHLNIDTAISQQYAKNIEAYFNSDAWKNQQKNIEKQSKEIQKYFSSNDWKKQQENIQKAAKKMKQYFESKEWKDQQKNIEKHSKEIEKYFNSDAWKSQQKQITEAANKSTEYFKSAEWKTQQKAIEEKTKAIQDYFNGDQWKKQQEEISHLTDSLKSSYFKA
ncbi:M56 family metallopeptidase, partial [Arachidicoccus sp.]|uniref:M56 family metallopeptidase n=1 Tax=Arachidicoccus sp. TaxID=1872624 RepID=UPI003D1B8CC3